MSLETNAALHQHIAWCIIMLAPLVATILVLWQPPTYGKLQRQHLRAPQNPCQVVEATTTTSTSMTMATKTATTLDKSTSTSNTESSSGTECGSNSLFGPMLSAQWCWIVFESPNWLWVGYAWYRLGTFPPFRNAILLGWFLFHYLYRSIGYPLQMSQKSKFPLGILAFSLPYCIVNGYLQSFGLCFFSSISTTETTATTSTTTWLYIGRWSKNDYGFVLGCILMMIGFSITIRSDQQLLRLRRTFATYQIPRGGWFEYVSCPHYMGEILEWIGFCMACQGSLASLSFVIWTMANLIPRALAQHEWYQRTFPQQYPKNRRTIIPFWL